MSQELFVLDPQRFLGAHQQLNCSSVTLVSCIILDREDGGGHRALAAQLVSSP